jgi:hypothetical protein
MNKIIQKFEEIRDLPYEIGPLHEGEDLIKYGRGGCGPKNRYLAKYFHDLGYKVKVCFTPYKWVDLELLPEEIRNHPKSQRLGDHIYLKVLINNKWVLIDSSWDKNLLPDFPVNLNWDGKSDQIPAVKIIKEICMDYPEPYLSWRKENKKQSEITKEDIEFRELMNKWLNKIRNDE